MFRIPSYSKSGKLATADEQNSLEHSRLKILPEFTGLKPHNIQKKLWLMMKGVAPVFFFGARIRFVIHFIFTLFKPTNTFNTQFNIDFKKGSAMLGYLLFLAFSNKI